MLYKCSNCGELLTEFDVNFAKNLYGTISETKCKCAKCTANIALLKKEKHFNFFKYLIPYFIVIYVVVFFKVLVLNEKIMNSTTESVLGIILLVNNITCIVMYIVYVVRCIKDFKGLEDESYERDCVRTTYDSSTNSLISSSSTETVGDDHGYEKFLLFLTYPFWGIFALIYRKVKSCKVIKNNFTKDILIAYDKTVKTTEKYIFPTHFCYPHTIAERFYIEEEKYAALKRDIRTKYSYLNEGVVQDKINGIKKPTIKIKSTQKNYDLVFIYEDKFFVKNVFNEHKIVFNKYALYGINEGEALLLFNLAEKNITEGENTYYIKNFFKCSY